ncbi:MAG: PaaI family thioesterase, partial [Nocardioides sp.]
MNLSDAEVDAIESRYEPVTAELRRLIDLTIRSEVGSADVEAALAHLRAASELLAADAPEGPAGIAHNGRGRSWQWGNAVVGQRNAIAPPLPIVRGDDGST